MNKYCYKFLIFFLIWISAVSIFGAAIYRVYALNKLGIGLTLIFSGFATISILYFSLKFNKNYRINNYSKKEKITTSKFQAISLLAYIALLIFTFFVLFGSRTDASIISPWQIVPFYFWFLYPAATAVLMALILSRYKHSLMLVSLHFFLSFSVAIIVYRLGYGYDPFIHEATMNLIKQTGSVEPKPFYYLGQYALLIVLNKITAIPLHWLNAALVPVLAALYLPLILWRVLKTWFNDQALIQLTIISLLILPFNYLIISTPQNFSWLLLIIALLLGLICKNYFDLLVMYILALAALVVHPLAGIPAVIFTMIITVYHSDFPDKLKRTLYFFDYLLLAAVLPLAFYSIGKTGTGTGQSASQINNIVSSFFNKLPAPASEHVLLNLIYTVSNNYAYLILLLIFAGLLIFFKFKKQCKIFRIYIGAIFALLVSLYITSKLSFSYLVYYEQADFLMRILITCLFFTVPLILTALYGFYDSLNNKNILIKIIWLCFASLLLSASLYLSYPRFDNFFNSHGYSVGTADIEAVTWIEDNAPDDYIVLANQQVSAAALKQHGFKKYYANDIFYYPIPTSSPLYPFYLDMVQIAPTKETAAQAMDLVGVDTLYFVLNKYWWAYPKIRDQAMIEADSFHSIQNGEVMIFKYLK